MATKRFIQIFAILLLPLVSRAQVDDGIHRYNTNFTVSATNFVDTIPILIMGNQVFIPVYIEGKRHLFNLDTGSSQGIAYVGSGISYSQSLGTINSKDANGRIDTIEVVKFPEISLGSTQGIKIRNYVGALLNRPKRHYIYDGIIGFDLFNKGLQAKIDVKRKRLIITDIKNFFDKEPGFELKYKLQRWTPYIEVNTFLDHKEPVLFDTGTDDFFVMNKQHFDAARYKDSRIPAMIEETTYAQSVVGSYGLEARSLMFFIHFPALPWGNFSFADIHATTTQGDSKFGAQILNYGTFVINPKKKHIKFWSYTGGNSVKVDNKVEDIAYIDDNNQPVVATIRHNSQLYKKGFREGDIVLNINGMPVRTLQEIQEYSFVKGAKYTFILQSVRGFRKEVTIPTWE